MTGAWLLANDLKQMSDCTGGRVTMQFDTASQNKGTYCNCRQSRRYGNNENGADF